MMWRNLLTVLLNGGQPVGPQAPEAATPRTPRQPSLANMMDQSRTSPRKEQDSKTMPEIPCDGSILFKADRVRWKTVGISAIDTTIDQGRIVYLWVKAVEGILATIR